MARRFKHAPEQTKWLASALLAGSAAACDRKGTSPPTASAPATPLREADSARAPESAAAKPADAPPPAPTTAPTDSNALARRIPKIELVSMMEPVTREVTEAYASAIADPTDPERIGQLGMLHYAVQSPGTAITLFQLAAELDPKDLRWRYFLGLAQAATFDRSAAIKTLQDALSVDASYAPMILTLAGLQLEEGPDSADRFYQQAIQANPSDPGGYVGRALCAEKRGDRPAALRLCEEGLRVLPDDPQLGETRARLLAAEGRKREAEEQRKRIPADFVPPLLRDPLHVELLRKTRNADFLIRLGREYARIGRFDDAIAVLQRASETDETHSAALQALGVVFAMRGDNARAIETLERILQTDPANTLVRCDLAKALAETGQYEKAAAAYKTVLREAPQNGTARSRYGQLLLWKGELEKAVVELRAVAEAEPNRASGHFDLAVGLVCRRDLAGAVEEYRKGLSLSNNRESALPEFVRQLVVVIQRQQSAASTRPAEERLELSRLAELADAFRSRGMAREADLCGDSVSLACEEAIAAARQGAADAALARLGKLIDADRSGAAHHAMGTIYALQRRFPEAVTAFRAAVQANPSAVQYQANLGNVLLASGQLDEAEKTLRQLQAQRPTDIAVLLALAKVADKRGHTDEARALLIRAVDLAPAEVSIRQLLGKCLARAGRFAEAADAFRAATQLRPSDADIRFEYGVALAQSGRGSQAIGQWRQALSCEPGHADARLALAGAAMKASDYLTAERLLKDGLRLAPNSAEMANGLAWLLATCPDANRRNGEEALKWATKACAATANRVPNYLQTLAAAQAAKGQFSAAQTSEAEALAIFEKQGRTADATESRRRLDLYKSRGPYKASTE